MTYKRVKIRYRKVSLVGKSTRRVKQGSLSKSKGYSLSVVIPSAMAKQLSIKASDIIKFEVNNSKSLTLTKVNLSD